MQLNAVVCSQMQLGSVCTTWYSYDVKEYLEVTIINFVAFI